MCVCMVKLIAREISEDREDTSSTCCSIRQVDYKMMGKQQESLSYYFKIDYYSLFFFLFCFDLKLE